MRLATVESLYEIIGGTGTQQAKSRMAAYLRRASDQLEAFLNTSFLKTSYDDLFFIDPQRPYHRGDYISLGLTAGWVRLDASPLVITAYGDYASALAKVGGDVLVDGVGTWLGKGEVKLYNKDLIGSYIRVSYEAGFTEKVNSTYSDTEVNTTLPADKIPSWLHTAALGVAEHFYEINSISDEKLKAKADKGIPDTIWSMVGKHQRGFPNSYKAIR